MNRRHLHVVDPDAELLALRDTTVPGEHSDEWAEGWRACREMLSEEWAVWYARGVAAQEPKMEPEGVRLDLFMVGVGAFIVGFVIAVALLA